MTVAFIQLPTSHLGAGERVYPLGLSRLASLGPASLRRVGLDLNMTADPWPALDALLAAERPRVVALSFRNLDPLAGLQVSYLSSLRTAARLVRTRLPEASVLAGGPAFSLFAERLLREVPEIDAGLIGEGENAFPALLADPGAAFRIPGTVWRTSGRVAANPAGPSVPPERIPPWNTHVFDPRPYLEANAYVAALGIEGKRGCDLSCSYCVYPQIGGRRVRLRRPGAVVDEMEWARREYGARLFHFTDGVLNRPADHFEALCREMLRRRLDVQWTGFFREDHLDEPQLELAMRAGLATVYFSGDSLHRNGLLTLHKRLGTEDLLRAARTTAAAGVLTLCHFLVNLPGETPEDREEARTVLDRILEIHASAGNLGGVVFNTVRLYPGAPLTRRLLRTRALAPGCDLLYPVYHNPPETAHHLHALDARCHEAGVFSRLGLPLQAPKGSPR